MKQLDLFTPTIEAAFEKFHAENPHVYELFERFTLQAIRSQGRERFGAKAVWERMRWYASFETTERSWKLNNNFTAYYAREFQRRNPECATVFETRQTAGG